MDSVRLKELLGGAVRLVYMDVTCSTNDDAKRLVGTGTAPVLVVAERQSSGRGRNGHSFSSPAGGIYMTLALPAALPADELGLVTSYAGRCVCEAIEETCALQPDIKWVNDVYIVGRKLAGILVEHVHAQDKPCLVVGIGINGLTAPKVLGGIPTTCLADHVKDPDLEQIAARVARKPLRAIGEGVDRGATIAYCQTHSMLPGKEATMLYDGSRITGYAVDMSDCGEPVVDTGSQTVLASSAASNVRLK